MKRIRFKKRNKSKPIISNKTWKMAQKIYEQRKGENEMALNRNAIEEHLKYLEEDKYDKEFYVALLLYDVLGIKKEEVTDEQIKRVYDLQDDYRSIYDEDLRDRLMYESELEKDELEEELEK